MPDYNVGPGIADQMAANGDHAIMDSDFITMEIGYGAKQRYIAQELAGGAGWHLDDEAWPDGSDSSGIKIIDRRTNLPHTGIYSGRSLSGITGITVHYTATDPSATVEAIAAGQLTRWADAQKTVKFPAIAYSLVVDAAGKVYQCHDLGLRPWHSAAGNRNSTHVGICWIGNHTPNAAQLLGLKAGIRWIQDQLGRSLPVEGHRDAPYATDCPGPTWPTWKAKIL